MTTYAYTGSLTDFGEAPFPGAQPSLWIQPLEPAFSEGRLLATRRVQVSVSGNGAFTVHLVASADLDPPSRYLIRCEWIDGSVIVGWSEWEFTALIGGGSIADMADGAVTNVWFSTRQPPVDRRGIYWINPVTGDVREWV